jgi:aspartate carbamoyltransferase catalytic subunit
MKRDIITIGDLTNSEIEEIFDLADQFLREMSKPTHPHRIRGRRTDAQSHIMAALFYEPSTRTRFSFEAAMLRLGGDTLGAADPTTTSAAKGESVADTVRVIENYADVIIIRHPYEGAARAAAEYGDVPVINAGDGGHEHPTQTLCDLYTLRKESKSLSSANVMLVGDLKNGRTVHSLVYALARFGANVIPRAAKGLELPAEVSRRLIEEYKATPVPARQFFGGNDEFVDLDVVYVSSASTLGLVPAKQRPRLDGERDPGSPHRGIDVCYVTRLQGERLAGGEKRGADYPVIDKSFMSANRFRETSVMHPLPRVNELGYDLDEDPRGLYFKQAAYGVPIRMALISKVLGIRPFVSTEAAPETILYTREDGIVCGNPRCISHHPSERLHLRKKFWLIKTRPVTLRCIYCEHNYAPHCYGDVATRRYTTDLAELDTVYSDQIVFFADETQAREAGFKPESATERVRHV